MMICFSLGDEHFTYGQGKGDYSVHLHGKMKKVEISINNVMKLKSFLFLFFDAVIVECV